MNNRALIVPCILLAWLIAMLIIVSASSRKLNQRVERLTNELKKAQIDAAVAQSSGHSCEDNLSPDTVLVAKIWKIETGSQWNIYHLKTKRGLFFDYRIPYSDKENGLWSQFRVGDIIKAKNLIGEQGQVEVVDVVEQAYIDLRKE